MSLKTEALCQICGHLGARHGSFGCSLQGCSCSLDDNDFQGVFDPKLLERLNRDFARGKGAKALEFRRASKIPSFSMTDYLGPLVPDPEFPVVDSIEQRYRFMQPATIGYGFSIPHSLCYLGNVGAPVFGTCRRRRRLSKALYRAVLPEMLAVLKWAGAYSKHPYRLNHEV